MKSARVARMFTVVVAVLAIAVVTADMSSGAETHDLDQLRTERLEHARRILKSYEAEVHAGIAVTPEFFDRWLVSSARVAGACAAATPDDVEAQIECYRSHVQGLREIEDHFRGRLHPPEEDSVLYDMIRYHILDAQIMIGELE